MKADPTELTRLDVQRYKTFLRENLAQTTASREFMMVKAAYTFAVDELGALEQSPFVGKAGKAPSVDYVLPKRYENEELRRIRAAIRDDLDEVIFYGLAYGGLRRFELVALKWLENADRDRQGNPSNAVDFAAQLIYVIGKGDAPRKVPLHPLLAKVLKAYRLDLFGSNISLIGIRKEVFRQLDLPLEDLAGRGLGSSCTNQIRRYRVDLSL